MATVFSNARIVLTDRVIEGAVSVEDGHITAIDEGASRAGDVDLAGDILIPGLVELHTDNLEKHYEPRKRVYWDPVGAAINHDSVIAAAGITTVFDCVCLGFGDTGELRAEHMRPMTEGLLQARDAGMLRADHRLHLRCEVIGETLIPQLDEFEPLAPQVGVVSLMDHAPGQRQTADDTRWKQFSREVLGLSEAEVESEYIRLRKASAEIGPRQRAMVAEWAHGRSMALASHDDETVAHVEESKALGCTIAEFPTTVTAAEKSREHGLAILMGGPNLVRGQSTSGNVTAVELAERGLLDIVSSDYVPASLIPAAFMLADRVAGWDLPRAVATITATPAETAGLADRGRIETGLRADLVRIRQIDGRPVVRGVWRAGERVV